MILYSAQNYTANAVTLVSYFPSSFY